ncbi:hypothetical protein PR202_gb05711 [Eleusine coracana subsp. coracana]|uniref:SHSP domain-containing protein n=1 Tax=Eleusine coracana subsp. coracana TaxID=191504 RepID=A0AAV5E557_ELECO|nr:hypothetical protein PR202_gb05711 [Eleusine coracana subsp. coracana]
MASCKPKRSAAKDDAPAAQPSSDVADIDPKLEWHDAATGYVIRLALPGFKKEDFKVQVDAGGRLTVRGERPAGYVRFHKAFQLPPTANVDAVAGRFDGSAECAAAAVVAREKEEAAAAVGKGQMVAAAVAGFALGVFVAHRILSAANS